MKQKLVLFFYVVFIYTSFAQINDSILSPQKLNSVSDTSVLNKPKKYDVDTTVFAEARDSIFFKIKEKKMTIFGGGILKYRQTEIKSGRIDI
ncbi:MAG: LPS-assembly protein LptD, partial [Ignavibacterium sp.]